MKHDRWDQLPRHPVCPGQRGDRSPSTRVTGAAHEPSGFQRCEEFQTFMRRVGLGGSCPGCLLTEAISVEELVGQELTTEERGRPSRRRRA